MCTADDEYDGYLIPKGTVVLGNTWSVSSWLDWSKTIRDSNCVLKGDSTQSRTISWTWGIQTWALPERWCIGSYCPRPKFCGVWLWSSVCICLFCTNIVWEWLIELNAPRICPGRHFSNNSLYAVVSSVLAVFDIKPPLDVDGRPSRLSTDVTSGLLSYVI